MLSRSRAIGPKMVPTMVRAAMSRLPTAEKFLPALRRMLLRESKYVETTKTQRHGGAGAIEDDSGTDNEIKKRISMSVPRLLRPPRVFVSLWFLHTYSRGATSSAEPAKTFRPSANVTLPPEPLLEPSLARKPSTLITSPTFKTSFVIPLLANMPGGPPENPHVVTFPVSSLTST